MFKRVLLCYDGSEDSRRALRRGADLAILVGAQAKGGRWWSGNPRVSLAERAHCCVLMAAAAES